MRRRFFTLIQILALAALVLSLAAEGWAAPTLARLSFWVPPERMTEFETVYQEKVVPILKTHVLVEYSQRGRANVEGIFSRLFEMNTPVEVEDKAKALREDAEWQEVLQNLGTAFGKTRTDGLIEYLFWHYSTPAGTGKVVPAAGEKVSAGPGRGHWCTYNVMDGLAGGEVMSIYQDRIGNLWFGTDGSGVSRYDGQTFTTFTTKDGLASNRIASIHEDKEGYLWFGTGSWIGGGGGGVSRYDGLIFTTFTTKDGLANDTVLSILQDKKGNLWFGTRNGGVSRYNGQSFITFTTEDGLANNNVRSIFQDRAGNLWFGTHGGGVSRYDGVIFTTFTTQDGLADDRVVSIYQDGEGNFWFGTDDSGVSRYDGMNFTTLTTQDGLADNRVLSILQDRAGNLWFGTYGSVSRYDGQEFTMFTTQDGLASNRVRSIWQDKESYLWFCTDGGGVSRYDGMNFTTLTTQDGLIDNWVWQVLQDRNGNFWFGTNGGVSQYDGQTFTTFTTKDGLANNEVWSISQDKESNLWFGTYGGGVSRYDGTTFTTFTTQDGLTDNWVRSILQDREGNLWFGTEGGVSRYNGQEFTTFTTQDGLADNQVRSIFQDKVGHLWFGSHGGVISRYDGQIFQTLTHRDGLTGNSVRSILQDREGKIWFATANGVVRYRPPEPSPPPVFIDAVVADRRYKDISEVTIPSTVGLVAFEFHGRSFKTRPEAMVYRYKLKGYDGDWKNTNARHVEYQNLPRGSYTFEVIAVDRDLVYSESPATVTLKIVPPFYLRAGFLAPTISFGAILLATLAMLATALIKRRRQVHAYQRAAVLELQDAREMQMSLMPESAPPIEGVEIAGKCLPANTVSGDFFDYLEGQNEIGLVIADVTGKGLKGAMNAVMADGILHSVAREQEKISSASLMMGLNEVLKARMEQYMNVTMVIGVISRNQVFDQNHVLERSEGSVSEWETTLTLTNAAHHAYPLLLRRPPDPASGGKCEIQTLKTGGLPLGMRAGVEYSEEQFPLQSGDVLIFMTDGIIEALDSEQRYYSDSGRLEETIGKFTLDLSAEAMVNAILNDAMNFGGDKAARDDDMTVVVAKIQ